MIVHPAVRFPNTNTLLTAMFRGNPVIVGHATAAELAAFTDRPSSELVDEITRWAVISVRSTPAGRMTTQHAIGWLGRLAIPWITSPLREVRSRPLSVGTISGQTYRLVGEPGEPVRADLLTVVSEHLACWGCTEIVAAVDRLGFGSVGLRARDV